MERPVSAALVYLVRALTLALWTPGAVECVWGVHLEQSEEKWEMSGQGPAHG